MNLFRNSDSCRTYNSPKHKPSKHGAPWLVKSNFSVAIQVASRLLCRRRRQIALGLGSIAVSVQSVCVRNQTTPSLM